MSSFLVVIALAMAASDPHALTVTLSHHNLAPTRIEVHVGEIVTWRSAGGEPVELRFDFHPDAHDVTPRAREVRAYFRKPGEHTYTGRVKNGPALRGIVSVRERDGGPPSPSAGECDRSNTLCLVP